MLLEQEDLLLSMLSFNCYEALEILVWYRDRCKRISSRGFQRVKVFKRRRLLDDNGDEGIESEYQSMLELRGKDKQGREDS